MLHLPEQRLLCIGYGFRDSHINQTILSAVKSAGLRVHVVSPSDPADFRKNLERQEVTEIWNKGLEGYHQYTLRDIFPGGGPPGDTAAWSLLRYRFFGINEPIMNS